MPTFINRGSTIYRVDDNKTIPRLPADPTYATDFDAYKTALSLNVPAPAPSPSPSPSPAPAPEPSPP